MKVVLASHNKGKIKEFEAALKNTSLTLITPSETLAEIPETGLSFVENALIKARAASAQTGFAALADDSGLVVPALNNAPGIYSARYAGNHGDSKANNNKLLTEMSALPLEKRAAYFYCALVFMLDPGDPIPLIATGLWHGVIAFEAKGVDGFGYDPVFYLPGEKKTAAELTLTQKNKFSHRALALQNLLTQLPDKLCQL